MIENGDLPISPLFQVFDFSPDIRACARDYRFFESGKFEVLQNFARELGSLFRVHFAVMN